MAASVGWVEERNPPFRIQMVGFAIALPTLRLLNPENGNAPRGAFFVRCMRLLAPSC